MKEWGRACLGQISFLALTLKRMGMFREFRSRRDMHLLTNSKGNRKATLGGYDSNPGQRWHCSDWGADRGGGEWSDSRCFVKIFLIGFPDGLE